MSSSDASGDRLRLGISACLLGREVRYNGGHTRDSFLVQTLGRWVEWVEVCPELEMGLGVPRENLRLIGDVTSPRLVAPKSDSDHTEGMKSWSKERLRELETLDLHGFVLKRASPSCGLFRVKVYDRNSVPSSQGRGIFAAALTEAMPLIPVEEEGRLNDPRLRENFIERIFVFRRWRDLVREPSRSGLVAFQAAHKLTLMAHSPSGQKELGRLVASLGEVSLAEVVEAYGRDLMRVMGTIATTKRHANVLQHAMGFVKELLDGSDKTELLEVIDRYRVGQLPLVVPLTLLGHHLRRHDVPEWLQRQTYLKPYPQELMLRNHV